MFIDIQELKTHLYEYQVDQITEGDDSIVSDAISLATDTVKSYIGARYDVGAIFSKSGRERSPLIVGHVKNIAAWQIVQLANVDAIYDRYEKAYDRTIDFLTKVAQGLLTPDLPYIETPDGTPPGTLQISSNPKFTHNF